MTVLPNGFLAAATSHNSGCPIKLETAFFTTLLMGTTAFSHSNGNVGSTRPGGASRYDLTICDGFCACLRNRCLPHQWGWCGRRKRRGAPRLTWGGRSCTTAHHMMYDCLCIFDRYLYLQRFMSLYRDWLVRCVTGVCGANPSRDSQNSRLFRREATVY